MSHRQATRFEDHTNSRELLFEEIGNGPVTEFTLAPAVEYNYSSNLEGVQNYLQEADPPLRHKYIQTKSVRKTIRICSSYKWH